MATNRRDVLLRLRAEGLEETESEVRTMRQELREFGNTEATARVDVRTAGVETQIKKVQDRLERLSKQEATPAVRVATARAVEQLDRLELKLEKLKHERVEVDVDFRRGALERTSAGLTALDRGAQKLGRGFADAFRGIPFVGGFIAALANGVLGLGEALGKVTAQGVTTLLSSFQSLGSFAGPIANVAGSLVSLAATVVSSVVALSLLAAAAQAVVGILISLAGVLGALLASLAAAVGGLAALAVAFGAVLGPAILAVVAFMTRFAAVLKARHAAEQEVTQAVQQQKTAEQQRKAALDASRTAHEQLAQATVDGNRAITQSIQDVRDAELGLEQSRLGVREARLSLAEARRDLRQFLAQAGAAGPTLNALTKKFSNVDFDPSHAGRTLGAATGRAAADPLELQRRILAVQQAQLGIKTAINSTTKAEQELARATKQRADYVRRGLDAYKPYRQALDQVRRADDRVAAAQKQVTSAHVKYEQALKKLTPTERGFLGQLDAFIKRFTDLAKVVSAPIFSGLGKAMQSLQGVFSDSSVQSGLEGIGKAIGAFFAALGNQLSTDRWRTAFAQFAAGAADMIRSAGRAFRAVLEIFRVIAQTALPTLTSIAHRVAGALENVASKPGVIRSTVKGLIKSFEIWASIAKNVAGIVLGFFKGAKGQGDKFATSINAMVTKWNKWVNGKAGQAGIRKFLASAATNVQSLLDAMPGIIEAFQHIADLVNAIAKGAQWLGNARRNAEHAVLGTGSISPEQAAARGLAAAQDLKRLRTHLSPEDRDQTRSRLAANLEYLRKHWGVLTPDFLKVLARLHKLGFQSGGLVPGSGSGDRVPAMLEPGEFVLRKAIVRQLSLPVVAALNGGAVPRFAASPPATASRSVTINAPISVPGGGPPDPRTLAAKLERELRLAG